MRTYWQLSIAAMACVILGTTREICGAQSAARLPQGVKAVCDLDKAYRR